MTRRRATIGLIVAAAITAAISFVWLVFSYPPHTLDRDRVDATGEDLSGAAVSAPETPVYNPSTGIPIQ